MRWEDIYWYTEEERSEEEQQSMQLIELWCMHCMCSSKQSHVTLLFWMITFESCMRKTVHHNNAMKMYFSVLLWLYEIPVESVDDFIRQ